LKEEYEKYTKLSEEEKKDFDTERLTNPYADSRILNGTGEEEIHSVIVGIDMETPEIVLANALRTSGKKIDLVLTHHPEGIAYATMAKVMGMQSDILNKYGVPITMAESMTRSRAKDVARKILPANHNRAVDAARLLGFPFAGAHTVADNHVADYLQKLFDVRQPKYVGDIIKILKEIPEYQEAVRGGAGPAVFAGSKDNRAGKVFVDMTGGTEGAKEALEKLANAGVGTIVGMHMSEEHCKNAEKNHINVVIAGHISSDNLGLNLLFDAVEEKFGPLEIFECSGFRRFRHK
jgi:putative NIF3 family GTP cyclohydrolase 1 type 2